MLFRVFGFSVFFTIASILIALFGFGWGAAFTTIVLIAVELAFSFDNAIINAKVLVRLSRVWQQLFLTVGMLIAIVGMRFLFPIVIVMITANLSWAAVVDAALNHPEEYAKHLEKAHTAISAFGGSFLLLLVLYFFFDDAREILWLTRFERVLQRIGGNFWLPPAIATAIIGLLAFVAEHDNLKILEAGLAGILLYTGIHFLITILSKLAKTPEQSKAVAGKATMYTGWSAFLAFIYLEVLDASFSFDGVLGAFAITDQILIIALGLGVGAFWVRSLTIYLVRGGVLEDYRYLEHGAHYAIFVLCLALLGSLFIAVPEAIVGFVGIGIIVASFISSREALLARQKGAKKSTG